MAQEPVRAPTAVPPLSATFSQPLPEYATKELAEQAFFGLLKETVSGVMIDIENLNLTCSYIFRVSNQIGIGNKLSVQLLPSHYTEL